MSLFAAAEAARAEAAQPLAARMRPRTLDEFAGQSHLLGEGKLLRRMLAADRVGSVILFGPPGAGKTTLAKLIAKHSKAHFESLNAAAIGVKEVRAVLSSAADRLSAVGARTVLFLDEIHRFSRSQQDVLLPDVEAGRVTLVGATTANPYFALVGPLLSRSTIFELKPLSNEEIVGVLQRALADQERGLGDAGVTVEPAALRFLAEICEGDARRALTGLEVAVRSVEKGSTVTLADAEESVQRKSLHHDAAGDEHYDVISAFIKSMRGSDPDATIYWLARMLDAGEDPRFLARRIVICAAEDVGNADPQALILAQSAASALEFVGMPEGRIPLAQAAVYVATAPKSNASYKAIDAALEEVRTKRVLPVPPYLKDPRSGGSRQAPAKGEYRYPHNYPGGRVEQDYLPEPRSFYEPTGRGADRRDR
ncbi:replication-associated recombination protein A [Alienimonas sp. DA493]|uniref:replication-associated recombination protein A n=1 Tax=Alienimonas sp. DA493 TaxID=3373605 RepID=UPI00375422C3